jgi:nicotinate-nucleotide adenylyltransferase
MTAAPRPAGRAPARVGILGGTFDPVHLGHLRMAECLREMFSLDRFLFIPAATPPHKPERRITPGKIRLAMIAAAVSDHAAFEACDLELARGGLSYSVETLEEALRARFGPEGKLHVAMGGDQFAESETWKEWRRIFTLANVVVATRPGETAEAPARALPVEAEGSFCYHRVDDSFRHESGMTLFFRDVGASISSTGIGLADRTFDPWWRIKNSSAARPVRSGAQRNDQRQPPARARPFSSAKNRASRPGRSRQKASVRFSST